MKTTNTATAVADYVPAPPFARLDGEARPQLGHRALLYLMQQGCVGFWRLDDETLDAAGWSLREAIAARGLSGPAAEVLAALERSFRQERNWREAEAAKLTGPALTLADPPSAPPAAPKGGGGSKVPRTPKPQGPAPSTANPLPVPAAKRQPAPVPVAARPTVPVLRPVAAPTLADADLF